jgi:hypothetical protein
MTNLSMAVVAPAIAPDRTSSKPNSPTWNLSGEQTTVHGSPSAHAPPPSLQFLVQASLPELFGDFADLGRSARFLASLFPTFRPIAFLAYEHMFWRPTHTSITVGAVHRALDLVRAQLLLEPEQLESAHGPVESRAPQSHRPQLRAERRRWRAGAVLERPQHCLCPQGISGSQEPTTPLVCSRPRSRALDKCAGGSLRLGG